MADQPGERTLDPQQRALHDAVPQRFSTSDALASRVAYVKRIDNARKLVAVAMAVCGLGFVICANRDDYLRLTLRTDSGIWGWGCWIFGIGVLACLTATLALIAEHLARPKAPSQFGFRSLFVRSALILTAVGAIALSMALAFGPWQAIGSVLGVFLALAAVRAHRTARVVLAVPAAVVLGLTLLGTQSAFHYARWHADEIVSAGCELMDRSLSTRDYTKNGHLPIDNPRIVALSGRMIQPDDPRVPSVLRKLGARCIWVDHERVAVYVGSNMFDFRRFPHTEIEFQIYRFPHPTGGRMPVWGSYNKKGSTKITDRLWTNDY